MNRYLMGPPPPGSLLKVETNQKLQIISGLAFKALKAFQGLQIKCKNQGEKPNAASMHRNHHLRVF